MNQQQATEVLRDSISELAIRFRRTPNLFYTENDLVCAFYEEFLEQCKSRQLVIYSCDAEKEIHSLIHTEYPTPFKCDMSKDDFMVVSDNSKHRRGHYDFVMLNPRFINRFKYSEIKAQHYKGHLKSIEDFKEPILMYAVESMFNRDGIKASRSKQGGLYAAKMFAKKVTQDFLKLAEGQNRKYIGDTLMLVFIRQAEDTYTQYVASMVDQSVKIITL